MAASSEVRVYEEPQEDRRLSARSATTSASTPTTSPNGSTKTGSRRTDGAASSRGLLCLLQDVSSVAHNAVRTGTMLSKAIYI